MCRSIKPLFNLEPPVTEDEVRAAALQFVRKISGFRAPSQANAAAFHTAVDEVTRIAEQLLADLESSVPPKSREQLAAQAKARSARRFGN